MRGERSTTAATPLALPLPHTCAGPSSADSAAYTLVAFDRISWAAAGLIAGGSLLGGFLGAHYGRRLSPTALRVVILVVGLIGLYRLLTV